MSNKRKPADIRQKELQLAISRIQHGRTKSGKIKISISAVAREAGVSAALIHNHYPEVVKQIREIQGISNLSQNMIKQQELRKEREKNRLLRLEIQELNIKISKLSSINEVLILESLSFKQTNDPGNIIVLPSKKTEKTNE